MKVVVNFKDERNVELEVQKMSDIKDYDDGTMFICYTSFMSKKMNNVLYVDKEELNKLIITEF